jgi:diacylglycerol kinase (ATP)
MRKAALLYNPDSGGSRRRQRELEEALAVLRNAGVSAELLPTNSPVHAGEEARRAIAEGCDTIFACGGDGTIHNIAQVLANTQVPIAVLPMGTANALAHDLGLPMNPAAAAKAALTGVPRRVALGRITYTSLKGEAASCYFTIAAGVGVDAHLFYQLRSELKQRMGMAAYYAKAWHLWFSYAMPRFLAEYATLSGVSQTSNVTELLAVRIRNFGGVIRELAPGASLDRNDLRLVMCRSARRWVYLTYVTRGVLGLRFSVPGVDLVHSEKVSCRYATEDEIKIYVEADGELLGTLPCEMTVVPDALTLLAPKR